MHVAERTDTLLLSRFLSVMVGWVAPSAYVADSYRSGRGQGAAGTLPERRLLLYVQLLYILTIVHTPQPGIGQSLHEL